MTPEKFKTIHNILDDLISLQSYLGNNIVWENQEGQLDHFDKLPKAEQIAIINIYNNVNQTISAINQFEHWFIQK